MKTDTTEKGLESLIMRHMTGTSGQASDAVGVAAETAPTKEGSGWFAGIDSAYDHCDVQRRRPTLQTVSRQRIFPPLADRYGLWNDLRGVNWHYDLTHRLARIPEKQLKDALWWESFLTLAGKCRNECRKTQWSFLLPPSQRTKARWFNLEPLIDWGQFSGLMSFS